MTNTAIIVNDVSKTFKIGKNRNISSIGKKNQNQKNILRALEGVTFTVSKREFLDQFAWRWKKRVLLSFLLKSFSISYL